MGALMFMDLWQTLVEKERFDQLAKDLGVLWVKDEVQEHSDALEHPDGPKQIPNEVRVPLALNIEPSLMETIRKFFGRKLGINPPGWAKSSEMVELYDETPENFLNFVRMFVRPKIVGK
jgi:hypothetical protein